MTEKDFQRLPTHYYCPFIARLVIKERKKLVELAKYNREDKVYELHELPNSEGNPTFGIHNTLKIEELVIADKRSYEGSFVKFYTTDFLVSLSLYALKVFVYITKILEINRNKVEFSISDISINCKIIEPRKIYDGINELIEKEIIAKHNIEGIYFVNPNIIFRGANRKILLEKKNNSNNLKTKL